MRNHRKLASTLQQQTIEERRGNWEKEGRFVCTNTQQEKKREAEEEEEEDKNARNVVSTVGWVWSSSCVPRLKSFLRRHGGEGSAGRISQLGHHTCATTKSFRTVPKGRPALSTQGCIMPAYSIFFWD